MRSVVVYSVLRVLAFLVPFGILMLFPAFREVPWLAAVFAALIGLALSVLLLRPRLDAVSTDLAERRGARRVERSDVDVEDAANDAARGEGPDADAEASVDDIDTDAEASVDPVSEPAPDVATEDDDAVSDETAQPTNAQKSSPA